MQAYQAVKQEKATILLPLVVEFRAAYGASGLPFSRASQKIEYLGAALTQLAIGEIETIKPEVVDRAVDGLTHMRKVTIGIPDMREEFETAALSQLVVQHAGADNIDDLSNQSKMDFLQKIPADSFSQERLTYWRTLVARAIESRQFLDSAIAAGETLVGLINEAHPPLLDGNNYEADLPEEQTAGEAPAISREDLPASTTVLVYPAPDQPEKFAFKFC